MSLEAMQEQSAPTADEVTQESVVVEAAKEQQGEEKQPAADADEAAFARGFDSARGVEAEPEPEPVRIAGYTEEELRDLLGKAKEVDKLREREAKVFGTLGSLKQAIDQLKQQAPAAPAAVALTGQLKRLSAEYPEMAEMLSEDLKEALAGGQPGSSASDESVNSRLELAEKKMEQKLLTIVHPDWRQVAASPEFEQWKGALPPDELQIVENSWDALSVADVLTKFKESRRSDQEQQAAAAQAKQTRQTRLEAAVAPRSARAMPGTVTDEDAFVAGFKRARGIG